MATTRTRQHYKIMDLARLYQRDPSKPLLDGFDELQELGLVELHNDHWRLTSKGRRRLLRSKLSELNEDS